MIGGHAAKEAVGVANKVIYDILINERGGQPRPREQIILIGDIIAQAIEACTKPTSPAEAIGIMFTGMNNSVKKEEK